MEETFYSLEAARAHIALIEASLTPKSLPCNVLFNTVIETPSIHLDKIGHDKTVIIKNILGRLQAGAGLWNNPKNNNFATKVFILTDAILSEGLLENQDRPDIAIALNKAINKVFGPKSNLPLPTNGVDGPSV